ncbi:DUF7410 domain-containing protein [Halosimplex amylolyticum]|uniref:DUF7410 domain-containing protein n=1 Tax=Halosimplex amylolyticum TaxID=3396616 RepID=UPI003F5709D3
MTDYAPTLRPTRDTAVPDGETPAATCPHCECPFRSEHARDLHVGERHEPSEAERERYEAALERERDDLWLFHAKAVVALGVIYAATVILYMAVLGTFF